MPGFVVAILKIINKEKNILPCRPQQFSPHHLTSGKKTRKNYLNK